MKLNVQSRLLVGLTLFSMFFGAGNLIFPPFLGEQAGTSAIPALIGFCVSAVGLPMLGVIAVAKSDGLPVLAGRVHPIFASVFTFLIYLSIGPCLAIPRTATTSFEIAAVPFLPEGISNGTAQLIYSIVFFAVALALALRPDKLTDRLGKLFGPALLTLILVVFVGCLLHTFDAPGEAVGAYVKNPAVTGFLEGYQTMDTIAALNFGFIIALNIRAKGVEDNRSVVGETCRAGVLAGIVLLAVYSALTYIGVQSGTIFSGAANGTEVLRSIVLELFGQGGLIILALIFAIACLNTCIGLISCCSDYFTKIFPFWGYRVWAVFFRCGQHAHFEHWSKPDPQGIGSGTGCHLPGCHCAHRAGFSASVHRTLHAHLPGVHLADRCCQRAGVARRTGRCAARYGDSAHAALLWR